jgi:HPt (histidine-containing phosphotransfer) domain-containing protein
MSDPAAILAARLADLWRKSRPAILERMATLHATQEALAANPEDVEARTRGREAAHKLSGVLGTFGLPQGSELAATLEEILKNDQPLSASEVIAIATEVANLEVVIASKSEV